VMYANENHYRYPRKATVSQAYPEDWIWWQTAPVAGRPVCDMTQSAIAKYLGITTLGQPTGGADPQYFNYFRCPSDDINHRGSIMGSGPYLYSYSMNYYLSPDTTTTPGGTAMVCPPIPQIRNASEKIVLVEETSNTINDGNWEPPAYDASGNRDPTSNSQDLLSTIHDRRSLQSDANTSPLPNPDRRGNVAFVDGHAEYVTRQYAHYEGHLYPNLSQ
jgi:prepilin-type processing-associated H-X9-DG protein